VKRGTPQGRWVVAALFCGMGCNALIGNDEHALKPSSSGGAGVMSGGKAAQGGAAGASASSGGAFATSGGTNTSRPSGGSVNVEGGALGSGGLTASGGLATTGNAAENGGGAGGASGQAGSAGANAGSAGEAGASGAPGMPCGESCFDGPPGRLGHGECKAGKRNCEAVCSGQILPSVELCGDVADARDENCDDIVKCAGGVQSAALFKDGLAAARMTIKRDTAGNEYWLGDYYQAFSIGGTALESGEQGDIFFAKLDPTGKPLWVKSIAGLGWQYSRDLVVHANGETTISGIFSTTTQEEFKIGSERLTTPNVGIGYGFLARFDAKGVPLWVDVLEAEFDVPSTVALAESANGGVYVWTVSGTDLSFRHGSTRSSPPMNFGETSSRASNVYLLQVGADGVLGKTFAGGWPQWVALGDISVTPGGTIYATGYHDGGPIDFGDSGRNYVDDPGFILKVDGPTSTKPFVGGWAAGFNAQPVRSALDSGGNLYVAAGATLGKWNPAGGNEWLKNFGAFAAAGVAVDAADYIVVAGSCNGIVDFNKGGTGGGRTSSGTDFCLAKYKADGTFLWSNVLGDQAVQQATAITTDPLGYIHALGTVRGEINLGNGTTLLQSGTSTALLSATLYP